MHICIADCTTAFGGALEQGKRVAIALANEKEHRVSFLSAQTGSKALSELPKEITLMNYPTQSRFWRSGKPKSERGILRHLPMLGEVFFGLIPETLSFAKELRALQPGVVILNNLLNAQLSGVLACRLLRIPCISVHQDFEFPSGLVKRIEPLVTHHIAISEAIKSNLLSLGIAEEKMSIIHNCVDDQRFSPNTGRADLHGRFGISPDKQVFAIFGRLVRWKGHEDFLEAAKIVLEKYSNSHALIIGDSADGEKNYAEELRLKAEALKVEGRLTFGGYHADIPQLLNAVDVAVHFSNRPEPFGLVVTEAMACEKPIVAMKEGGPIDIVIDKKTGFLVPPRNPAAAAEAIGKLLESEELRRSMGQAGRKRVIEKFSAQACAKLYAHLCDDLVCHRSARTQTE